MASVKNKEITLEELAKHDKDTDGWMALNGKVYNVTDYIPKHPGGKAQIMQGVGKDATAMFKQAHSYVNPEPLLKGKQVGVLKKPRWPIMKSRNTECEESNYYLATMTSCNSINNRKILETNNNKSTKSARLGTIKKWNRSAKSPLMNYLNMIRKLMRGWQLMVGKVYDVTDYIALHPGGKFLMMLGVGKDATTLFNEAHSFVNPDVDLNGKQVGVLKKSYRVCIPYSIDAERALRNTLIMTSVKPVTVSQFSPAEPSGSVGSRNNEPTDTIQDRSELQPGPSNASQGPIIKYYYACSRKPDTVMESHEEIEKPKTTTENDTPVQESRVPSETIEFLIESDEQTSNESINMDDDSPRSH